MDDRKNLCFILLSCCLTSLILLAGCESNRTNDNTLPAKAADHQDAARDQDRASTEQPDSLYSKDELSQAGLDEDSPPVPSEIMLEQTAPLYDSPMSWSDPLTSHQVSRVEPQQTALSVVDNAGEWLAVSISTRDNPFWLPSWYADEAAADIEEVQPYTIQLSTDSCLHLFPDSQLNWCDEREHDINHFAEMELVVIQRWNDWVGFAVPSETWQANNRILFPVLLWVPASKLDKKEQAQPLFSANLSFKTVAQTVELLLLKGSNQDEAESLLGKPEFIEASKNISLDAESAEFGEVWRYEQADGHLSLTFSPQGKLIEKHFQVPLTSELQRTPIHDFSSGSVYDFTALPLVPTKQPTWIWQQSNELAHHFIWQASDDTLLIIGDDGGFSGMHYNSNLQAVDRETGEQLWQLDAGHSGIFPWFDPEQKFISIYTPYNPHSGEYDYRLRSIRLQDGQVRWERSLDPQSNAYVAVAGAQGIIISYTKSSTDEHESMKVWQHDDGKLLWEQEFTGQILNRRGDEPFILVKNENMLEALDPMSGEIQWTVSVKSIKEDEPIYPPFQPDLIGPTIHPFAAGEKQRWFYLGNKYILIELETGQVISRLEYKMNEKLYFLSEEFILIVRGEEADLSVHKSRNYETVLYDIIQQQELWSLPGHAGSPIMNDQIIYMEYDGIPIAVDVGNGKILWEMETSVETVPRNRLSFGLGHHQIVQDYLLWVQDDQLLVVDKNTGKPQFRVAQMNPSQPGHSFENSRAMLISQDGESVYMGSVNGMTTRFTLP